MKLEIKWNEFNDNHEVFVDGKLYTQFTDTLKVNIDFDGKQVKLIESRAVPYKAVEPKDVGL
jgi:hypothetical protein